MLVRKELTEYDITQIVYQADHLLGKTGKSESREEQEMSGIKETSRKGVKQGKSVSLLDDDSA